MNDSNANVRNVSDTARWVAYFRARETERADALFRDRFAERLAGERGFQIAHTLPEGNKHEWAWATRTYLFDRFLLRGIRDGADVVINLGAGLDARPYRLDLPSSLRWFDVDLAEILRYKNDILSNEKPKCQLQQIYLDLSHKSERQAFFQEVNRTARQVAVLSEGLLIYFAAGEVGSLSSDLSASRNFHSWVVDLASPGQLKSMQARTGKQLGEAGAPFKFGPQEGPNFFTPFGWEPIDVQGMLKTAALLQRAPKELLSLLPEPDGIPGEYPWTGVCLLKRTATV